MSKSRSFLTLSANDTPRMASLHMRAFPPEEVWSAAQFTEFLSQESVRAIGIEQGEALLAFGLFQLAVDQADILTLATDPAVRRGGLATQLLLKVETDLVDAGLTKWLLDVAEDNPGARAFYEKIGFVVDGRRPGYYNRLEGSRVDAILMSKPMAGQAPA